MKEIILIVPYGLTCLLKYFVLVSKVEYKYIVDGIWMYRNDRDTIIDKYGII
jgi:hypothetical protein